MVRPLIAVNRSDRTRSGFVLPLARSLPQLSEPEVCWALHFAVGLPHQCTDTNFKRVKALSDGQCDTANVRAVLELSLIHI